MFYSDNFNFLMSEQDKILAHSDDQFLVKWIICEINEFSVEEQYDRKLLEFTDVCYLFFMFYSRNNSFADCRVCLSEIFSSINFSFDRKFINSLENVLFSFGRCFNSDDKSFWFCSSKSVFSCHNDLLTYWFYQKTSKGYNFDKDIVDRFIKYLNSSDFVFRKN